MGAILSVIPLIQTALGVIGAFKGTPQVAKVTAQVQDALGVVTALTPLVQQFASGQEVTPEDVRAALAGKDKALSDLDAQIAATEAEEAAKK